jgi:glucokinase-like ROK family protein
MRRKNHHGVDHHLMRDMNEIAVLLAIINGGLVSRRDITAYTHLTDSTVSHVTRKLLNQNLLEEVDVPQERRGRPEKLLLLRPQAARLLSLVLEVDHYEIGLVDLAGRLSQHQIYPLAAGASADEVLPEVAHRLSDLLAEQADPVWGLGVSVPGVVSASGTLISSPNLQWSNVPIRAAFEEAVGIPVMVANEADAAALGEYYFGNGKGSALLIYLSLGVGIGCGIVMEGHLFTGVSGAAGEVGHTTLMLDGPPCPCGRRGCFEALASTRALVQTAQGFAEAPVNLTSHEVIARATAGERFALQAVHNIADYVGQASVNLINLFDPDRLILGGALAEAGNYLLWPVERRVENDTISHHDRHVSVQTSAFGRQATIIGSGACVLEQVLQDSSLGRRIINETDPIPVGDGIQP